MVANARKSNPSAKQETTMAELAAEERSLLKFNRLIAHAAPRPARETAAALLRFHRDIVAQIRRTG
jgi:hypothetical protein